MGRAGHCLQADPPRPPDLPPPPHTHAGISLASQRLSLGDRELADADTLAECQLQAGAELTLRLDK